MIYHFRIAIVLAAVCLGCLPGPVARADVFTLDDMLKVEGTGWAAVDPAGEWLVYERLRPYDTLGDYSFRTYAARKSGHQVWRAPVDRPGEAVLLPGLDQAPHTYLESFSPSGRFLALYQYTFGDLSLVLYDMQSGRTVRSVHTPSVARSGEQSPVWTSDTQIVFSAEPDGQRPGLTSIRADAAARITSAWAAAFRGEGATATEVRTQASSVSSGFLVRLDGLTGRETVIATGHFLDLRLSPDGARLAALKVRPAVGLVSAPSAGPNGEGHQLVVFDLAGGPAMNLAPGRSFHPYTLDWSPGSDRLLAFGQALGRTSEEGQFIVIDASTGAWAAYPHTGLDLASERERGWRQRPERAVFLGSDIAVFARALPAGTKGHAFTHRDMRPRGLAEAGWYRVTRQGEVSILSGGLEKVSAVPVDAGPGYLTVLAAGGVYSLSEDGGRTQLAALPKGQSELVHPGRFSAHPWVSRPDYTGEVLIRVDTLPGREAFLIAPREEEGTNIARIVLPSAAPVPLAGSVAAGAVIYQESAPPKSGLRLAFAGLEKSASQLASINEHLEAATFGTWKQVVYVASVPGSVAGSLELESCVLLPEGFDPARPPPLVVDVYPGNLTSCRKTTPDFSAPYFFSAHLWAAKGYAYVQLATPRELIRTEEGPLAGLPGVVDAGISALVEAGYAEDGHISLFGFSQGGYSALFTAARLDRFNAVIAVNGWSDLFSHYFGPQGVFSLVQPAFGEFSRYDPAAGTDFSMGRTPFEDPDAYYRNSAVLMAPDITAPVLLVHSDLDSFSITQFDMMFAALQRAGKDARYVRYWGEGHGPSSPGNIRDMWARFDAFLTELQPGRNSEDE